MTVYESIGIISVVLLQVALRSLTGRTSWKRTLLHTPGWSHIDARNAAERSPVARTCASMNASMRRISDSGANCVIRGSCVQVVSNSITVTLARWPSAGQSNMRIDGKLVVRARMSHCVRTSRSLSVPNGRQVYNLFRSHFLRHIFLGARNVRTDTCWVGQHSFCSEFSLFITMSETHSWWPRCDSQIVVGQCSASAWRPNLGIVHIRPIFFFGRMWKLFFGQIFSLGHFLSSYSASTKGDCATVYIYI